MGIWIPKEESSSTIEQLRVISLLSVKRKIFFSIVAQCMTEFLLKNTYIDTSVQKGGSPKGSRMYRAYRSLYPADPGGM